MIFAELVRRYVTKKTPNEEPTVQGFTSQKPCIVCFVEGGFKVEKIVLIADHPKKRRMLVKCISILFPECEIEVVPRNKEIDRCVLETVEPGSAVNACE